MLMNRINGVIVVLITTTLLVTATTHVRTTTADPVNTKKHNNNSNNITVTKMIPNDLLGAFGSYPNVLHITESERTTLFHPIMYFPYPCWTKTTKTTGTSTGTGTSTSRMTTTSTSTALPSTNKNNKKHRVPKRQFVCPIFDFTATAAVKPSESVHASRRRSRTRSSSSSSSKPTAPLLSEEEFQVGQAQRQRRQQQRQQQSSRLQHKLQRLRQTLQRQFHHSVRHVLPTIHYYWNNQCYNLLLYHPILHIAWSMVLLHVRRFHDIPNTIRDFLFPFLQPRSPQSMTDFTSSQQEQHQQHNNSSHHHQNNSNHSHQKNIIYYYIGKYDEDRIGLYTSNLFRTTTTKKEEDEEEEEEYMAATHNQDSIHNSNSNSNSNSNISTIVNNTTTKATECTFRTIHVGMDLTNGYVGTPIYAFIDGIVHSIGYNPDRGDYGNVMVIQHIWYRHHHYTHSSNDSKNSKHKDINSTTTNTTTTTTTTTTTASTPSPSEYSTTADANNTTTTTTTEKVSVYALYGHLNDASSVQFKVNDTIRRGQLIGQIGNVYENGGWTTPHLHFQLSTIPPPNRVHDMPGTICRTDRPTLLYQYIDPRYVLGELY
jgi:Peptidase family M23